MSSTSRGSARNSFDSYPTPRWCVTRLLDAVDWKPVGTWLEPCAGDGRIIQTVDKHFIDKANDLNALFQLGSSPFSGIHWHAWDIQREYEEPLLQLNATTRITDIFDQQPAADPVYDIVITNPPYNIAMDVLLWSRQLAPIVALLLRRNFIGSIKRHPYLSQNMPAEYLLPNRPSFIWVHAYSLVCHQAEGGSCGMKLTGKTAHKVTVKAGQKATPNNTQHDTCSRCGGVLVQYDVKTTTADSCEYCWCVWTPESGPVGSTRMLALTSPEEMAQR